MRPAGSAKITAGTPVIFSRIRHRYIVQRGPSGSWELRGPDLPFAMPYRDESNAVGYAHFLLRHRGGSIVIVESNGNTFTECVQASPESGLRICNGHELPC